MVIFSIGDYYSSFIFNSSDAAASGFALVEQSGKGLGEAFAGGRTDTEEASSLFYNPAAMAFMKRNSVGASFSVIDVSLKFKDEGSHTVTGAPLTGGNGGDGGTLGLIPNLYFVHELMDQVKIGLTINAPFGLATKYSNDWKGRYHSVETDLRVIGISPSVAVEVLPEFLSLGASVNIEYADAKLTNAIDFGTILMAGEAPRRLWTALPTLRGMIGRSVTPWDYSVPSHPTPGSG